MFVHDAILEAVTCGDTQIDASDLRTTIQKLTKKTSSGRTSFELHFSVCSFLFLQLL